MTAEEDVTVGQDVAPEQDGPVCDADLAVMRAQLGRPVRGVAAVGHRCECGLPDVAVTRPRLPDGTPFPTTFYLTCPRMNSAIGTLEASGLMARMQERLAEDEDLARRYRAAHRDYLDRRAALGDVPEVAGVSAGGMPERVKCLHVLAAHALAAGPGVNPFGDEVLELLGPLGERGPCVPPRSEAAETPSPAVSSPAVSSSAVSPADEGRPLAAIDCGTNSIRLLVAAPGADGLVELDRRMRQVRLGEGVDRTGRLSRAALERTWAACETYREVIAGFGVRRLRFVATSASRDAANAAEFIAGVERILGVTPEVITGRQEARLSFLGATRGLEFRPPALVFDIGGGSTELVLGDNEPEAWASVDLGCVRMTERHVTGDPMSAADRAAIERAVDLGLDPVGDRIAWDRAATVIGLAGTVTTIAALAEGLTEYRSERIQGVRLQRERVDEIADQLLRATTAERAALPVMLPGRADVITAGVLILRGILARTGAESLLVSEHDILDGMVWSLVDEQLG